MEEKVVHQLSFHSNTKADAKVKGQAGSMKKIKNMGKRLKSGNRLSRPEIIQIDQWGQIHMMESGRG